MWMQARKVAPVMAHVIQPTEVDSDGTLDSSFGKVLVGDGVTARAGDVIVFNMHDPFLRWLIPAGTYMLTYKEV